MPRINEDPTDEVCPDYGSDEWQTVRQDLIEDHAEMGPMTHEVAAQRLRATWTAMQRRRISQWNQQKDEDQRVAEAHREEEERRRAELVREADELQKEQEKKKPKINSLDPNCSVGNWIAHRPSAYALNKVHQAEYVELDYFTPRGCRQAYLEQERSSTSDTFGLTHIDNVVAFQPISSLKPSKNIRRDEELSWDEIVFAKNKLIKIMSKSDVWPQQHTMSLAAFYVMLETHQVRESEHGNKILATYASRVRREWFDLLKRPGAKVFNLEIINEDLLRAIGDEVKDAARAEEMKSMREAIHIGHKSRSPQKRTYNSFAQSRSPSPPAYRSRHDSPKKRTRSDSPNRASGSSYNHSRDHGKRSHFKYQKYGNDNSGFRGSAGSRPSGVCASCLGRHEWSFAKCNTTTLWNGQKGEARKNDQGRLVTAEGLILCFDWQLPAGCHMSSHPEKHRCSGCGKTDHGAQSCPLAEAK